MSEMRVDATGDCLTEMTGDFISQSDTKSNCSSADRAPSNINSVVICQAVCRSIFGSSTSSAAERVSLILKQEENEEASCPILFIQLSELFSTAERQEWRQTARWIKFEEKVEDGGERWSKPHVTTLPLHSLFELRTCIRKGAVLLDLEAHSFKLIVEKVIEVQIEKQAFKPELLKKLAYILLLKPYHHAAKSQLKMLFEMGMSFCADRANRHSDARCEVSEVPLMEQLNNRFKKKIPAGTEVANILVGEISFLEKPFIAFVRLQKSVLLGSLTEVAFPSRFLFILLGPRARLKAYHEIGRAMATLLTDELFQKIAWKAKDTEDLIAGIDEFLDDLTVLPPGKWDPTIRICPPKSLPSPQKRISMRIRDWSPQANGNKSAMDERQAHGHPYLSEELEKTGRLFGGLLKDIQRKAPWYGSDFSDGLSLQCLSAILYIYLATVTNAITFGGMLGDATDNMQGVLESFLGTAFAGAFFCLFAGQPLTILSSTGPVLVFERLLFSFSKDHSLDYLEFRLWIGLWVAFFGLILVATEASYLVQYFTRFTEEGFCALISFIFIYDAVKKMLSLVEHYPVNWEYKINDITLYSCTCNRTETGNSSVLNQTLFSNFSSSEQQSDVESGNWSLLTKDQCIQLGGHLVGNSCNYVPDITFMSFILFLGTLSCAMALKKFKSSRYFPTGVRKLVGDFSIILAILIFCGIDAALELETPKLIVPNTFQPTNPKRDWLVFPFGANPWWIYLVSSVPAILVIILIFMDQQITAVILNRKEYKLQKGAGFHLDFLCVSLLMIVTSFMGLPWYVSATVISLAHMDSLKKESTTSAPGEQPKFLGIREQRVTGLVVFILTGLSVFLAPVLKFIPMPVLYGIFFYMGISALSSIQFMERLQLLLMPAKHQPDFIYLRHVPLCQVHLYTFIQIFCLAVLWLIKSTAAAIIFPLMLLALVGIRKAMEYIFPLQHLSWLDDIMPEKDKKEEEEKLKRIQDQDESDNEDSELMYQEKGPEINISVN
ncbi:anion exchange protein 4 isoform X1 [Crotalus tigris]|uniref:anion exchange protein 4 isoform X1 n=1 Tax=Crotalus tigris TaxID=88082 RepID=UPI00192F19CF|nr:anion exchange protein 4 isoform X1 [Crotalus tigris]XP_039182021.1 anion exchange protein 4 isoform X1 [Crotalus tigris]XP_039182022.1 anion exchange protein 4 isoform X1 [Crotalus tigris]